MNLVDLNGLFFFFHKCVKMLLELFIILPFTPSGEFHNLFACTRSKKVPLFDFDWWIYWGFLLFVLRENSNFLPISVILLDPCHALLRQVFFRLKVLTPYQIKGRVWVLLPYELRYWKACRSVENCMFMVWSIFTLYKHTNEISTCSPLQALDEDMTEWQTITPEEYSAWDKSCLLAHYGRMLLHQSIKSKHFFIIQTSFSSNNLIPESAVPPQTSHIWCISIQPIIKPVTHKAGTHSAKVALVA